MEGQQPEEPTTTSSTAQQPVAEGGRPGEALVGADDTNARSMRCGRCTSVLLLPNKATLCRRSACSLLQELVDAVLVDAVLVDAVLGSITLHKSRGGENAEQETLDWHWEVATMWEFENMGFSNTLSLGRPAKYLTCADCEQDVLGVHYLDETKLYVAASRVDYA